MSPTLCGDRKLLSSSCQEYRCGGGTEERRALTDQEVSGAVTVGRGPQEEAAIGNPLFPAPSHPASKPQGVGGGLSRG